MHQNIIQNVENIIQNVEKIIYATWKSSMHIPWWKVCQLHQRSLAWHTANVTYFSTGEPQSLVQEKQTFHYGAYTVVCGHLFTSHRFIIMVFLKHILKQHWSLLRDQNNENTMNKGMLTHTKFSSK